MTTSLLQSSSPVTADTVPATLADLGAAVARDGIAAHETAITAVVDQARAAGVRPISTAVLADPTQPWNARVRALIKLSIALSKH